MATNSETVLSVRDLDVAYGHLLVVRNAEMDVGKGEVVALLGANGAGKTTLLGALSGQLNANRGSIAFEGVDITGLSIQARARIGVCLIPEGRSIFPGLTVRESLRLAASADNRADYDRFFELFPDLKSRMSTQVGSLSGGQQQMVAMARCFLTNPRLILLDEVSLGLAPQAVDAIYESLSVLKDDGVSMILVEQYVDRALSVADRVYVMRHGQPSEAKESARLVRDDLIFEYLGSSSDS
jgi:branched-chain amino acid transport system ATP-binding protein